MNALVLATQILVFFFSSTYDMVLMYDYGRLRGLFAQVYLQTEHASATSQKRRGGGYIPHPPPRIDAHDCY